MLNTAILMGRLTADPELRRTSTDIPVTSFTLAVDRDYVRSGAERQADFIDIVCWRSTAEFASKYFHKGLLVAVEGNIQTRTYTDSQNVKRKAFEIVANRVHFAESRKDGAQNAPGAPYQQPAAKQEAAPASADKAAGDNGDFIELDGDDELPF